MANNRDDFSEKTKRDAAGRVGWICSFPGCNSATIGASMESNSKVSNVGVAAHICAAAEGGPRYDPNMTPDERKSIDNCIWLCETHAHLIDTDTKKYTVSVLKKWKNDAEKRSTIALADRDFFCNYYNSNGENLDVIERLFEDMITDGRFGELCTMLGQYKSKLSEKYDEFVLRYKITYDVYCNRSELNNDLQCYCALVDKSGADSILSLFISFLLIDEIRAIIQYGKDPGLLDLAEAAINGSLEKNIFFKLGEKPQIQISAKYHSVIYKMQINLLRERRIMGINDPEGNVFRPESNEFYYKVISNCYEINRSGIGFGQGFCKAEDDECFSFLIENIEKIKMLDTSLQLFVWETCLTFALQDKNQFNEVLQQCPEYIKETPTIKRIRFLYFIEYDKKALNVDEMLRLSDEMDNYSIIIVYLSGLNDGDRRSFLNDHQFLYAKSSDFLYMRMQLPKVEGGEVFAELIEKYSEEYEEDFLYHCICAKKYSFGERGEKEINWLLNHSDRMPISGPAMALFIQVLNENKRWKEILAISKMPIPQSYKVRIAEILGNSDDLTYIKESAYILSSQLDSEKKEKGMLYNLGVVLYRLGKIEEAKKCMQREYDEYGTAESLRSFIRLRYESDDIIEDKYLNDLRLHTDAESQNLLGAFYLRLKDISASAKYFLRSLLIDSDSTVSAGGYWQACIDITDTTPEMIDADTVISLSNKARSLFVALHSADILEGIAPNNLFDCCHYSIEDPQVAPLLYHVIGEKVSLFGEEYTIETIECSTNYFAKKAFETIAQSPNMIKIYGSSPEEFKSSIVPILKSDNERIHEIVSNYNALEIKYPVSEFARIVGKPILTSIEFLIFGNKDRIRNNPFAIRNTAEDCIYVVSYDSIVFLLHMGIENEIINKLNLICPVQVKNQIIADVDQELGNIKSKSSGGTLVYTDDDGISILSHNAESKRNRYEFLTKLKKFAKSIPTGESCDYSASTTEMQGLFRNSRLQIESGALGLAQKNEDAVLVTDDQALYIIANTESIKTIGLTTMITYAGLQWQEMIYISKELARLNFANYLPFTLYKSIIESILSDSEHADEAIGEMLEWIKSDNDNAPSEHHKKVIIALFAEVYNSGLDYLNLENRLSQIAISFFEELNKSKLQPQIIDDLI